jgi:hypothetical protein
VTERRRTVRCFGADFNCDGERGTTSHLRSLVVSTRAPILNFKGRCGRALLTLAVLVSSPLLSETAHAQADPACYVVNDLLMRMGHAPLAIACTANVQPLARPAPTSVPSGQPGGPAPAASPGGVPKAQPAKPRS